MCITSNLFMSWLGITSSQQLFGYCTCSNLTIADLNSNQSPVIVMFAKTMNSRTSKAGNRSETLYPPTNGSNVGMLCWMCFFFFFLNSCCCQSLFPHHSYQLWTFSPCPLSTGNFNMDTHRPCKNKKKEQLTHGEDLNLLPFGLFHSQKIQCHV